MNIGVLGFGTVASAVVQNFINNNDLISSKTDASLRISKVGTRTPAKTDGYLPEDCIVTSDCKSVVNDPDIDVVVELIGGTELARELVMLAISNRKHVITANKALLALHGESIFEYADEMGVCVLFEGAVAVSIPIVKTLKESVAASRISAVHGILNGTSNYILTQMSQHGATFEHALKEAQEKGYAEADPTLDVNGGDAAHKLALLSAMAFGVPVNFETVHCKGISDIELVDIAGVSELGYELRLVAETYLQDDHVWSSVSPTLVPKSSMLSKVNSSMNGITLTGDLFGSAFLYGAGAGGKETASAVLADILGLAQALGDNQPPGLPNMGFKRSKIRPLPYLDELDRKSRFYVRLRVEDRVGMLAEISSIFADANISVSAIVQNECHEASTDILILTHTTATRDVKNVLSDLERLVINCDRIVLYPALGDD